MFLIYISINTVHMTLYWCYRLSTKLLSVDSEWVSVGCPGSVEVIIVLEPVVIISDPVTTDGPEAAALAQEAVTLWGLEERAEHAEPHQRGQELDQEEERQVCQAHPELDRSLVLGNALVICNIGK